MSRYSREALWGIKDGTWAPTKFDCCDTCDRHDSVLNNIFNTAFAVSEHSAGLDLFS